MIKIKQGVVESEPREIDPQRQVVTLWPTFDTEDRIQITSAATGVLLAIVGNFNSSCDNAVFLTIEEIERIAVESRRLYQGERQLRR